MASVAVSGIKCKGVGLEGDKYTLSDPYVKVSVGDVSAQTSVKWDSADHAWPETLTLPLSEDVASKPMILNVAVYDKDVSSDDDLIGSVEVNIDAAKGTKTDESLGNSKGVVSFSWERTGMYGDSKSDDQTGATAAPTEAAASDALTDTAVAKPSEESSKSPEDSSAGSDTTVTKDPKPESKDTDNKDATPGTEGEGPPESAAKPAASTDDISGKPDIGASPSAAATTDAPSKPEEPKTSESADKPAAASTGADDAGKGGDKETWDTSRPGTSEKKESDTTKTEKTDDKPAGTAVDDKKEETPTQSTNPEAVPDKAAAPTADAGGVAKETPAADASDTTNIVTRKNINSMSDDEQERVALAIKQMMVNASGAGTSRYATLAGYHGWPNRFCHHGQETFPAWHRGYLVAFESELQNADVALGNDGKIGLPYWDWSDSNTSQFPPILRKHFGEIPSDLVDASAAGALGEQGYRIRSDEDIAGRLQRARVTTDVQDALERDQHWQFASTRFRRGISVEDPHNDVHVAVGFPLSSVAYAAFHPAFFLHHCMVDRICQAYFEKEGVEECKQEFIASQAILVERGEENRYLQPLHPFSHPVTGKPLTCADTFEADKLGFRYDSLPVLRDPQIREMPVYALFRGLKATDFSETSYTVHVFVIKQGETFTPPTYDTVSDHAAYAGSTSVFGGRGDSCDNCNVRGPFNIRVDITTNVTALGVETDDIQIEIVLERDDGKDITEADIKLFPVAQVRGPVFTKSDLSVLPEGTSTPKKDVKRLQTYLRQTGYYSGAVDGLFSTKTLEAVKAYQKNNGLTTDGIVGQLTKACILSVQHDQLPHEATSATASLAKSMGMLKYFLGQQPGYIKREKYEAEVKTAFSKWTAVTGIKFESRPTSAEADISVQFGADGTPASDDADFVASDGQGGMLAFASVDGVTFDPSERWLLQGQKHTKVMSKAFEILPVLIHEIGHVLGLPHTHGKGDVMSPYYVPGRVSFSASEKKEFKKLFKAKKKPKKKESTRAARASTTSQRSVNRGKPESTMCSIL